MEREYRPGPGVHERGGAGARAWDEALPGGGQSTGKRTARAVATALVQAAHLHPFLHSHMRIISFALLYVRQAGQLARQHCQRRHGA